jgi:hypothetical protein
LEEYLFFSLDVVVVVVDVDDFEDAKERLSTHRSMQNTDRAFVEVTALQLGIP